MGNSIDKLVRDGIKKIEPYIPGKPIEEVEREYGIEKIIKLASNENPLGPSPKVKQAIRKRLNELNRYPESSGYYLKNEISRIFNIPYNEIILGSGSSEIISMTIETFLNPQEEVIYPFPSFIIYRILVLKNFGIPVEIPLEDDFSYNLDKFLERINPKTKIIILCSPNNPTGTIVYKEQIEKFLEKLPDDIILISDEAYWEYVETPNYGTCLPYYKKKNIIIARTFSKIYGLAALRIGYGIGKEEILSYMERIRPPFNTTSIAQFAAIAALNDKEYLEKIKRINSEGKLYLYRELEKFGIKCIPTQANFILCKFNQDAEWIVKELEKKGVIIRLMKGFGLSSEYVRITIGTEKENKVLIRKLKEVLNGGRK